MSGLLVTPLKDVVVPVLDGPPASDAAREYVRSRQLASEIESWLAADEDRTYHRLAELAGVSPRAVSKILTGVRRYQTVYLADRLMMAMDRNITQLPTVRRNPWKQGQR